MILFTKSSQNSIIYYPTTCASKGLLLMPLNTSGGPIFFVFTCLLIFLLCLLAIFFIPSPLILRCLVHSLFFYAGRRKMSLKEEHQNLPNDGGLLAPLSTGKLWNFDLLATSLASNTCTSLEIMGRERPCFVNELVFPKPQHKRFPWPKSQ